MPCFFPPSHQLFLNYLLALLFFAEILCQLEETLGRRIMFWIHCNRCAAQPQHPGNLFFLSNCGHILCDACNRKCLANGVCAICSTSPIRSVQIGNEMKKDVRMAFESLENKFAGMHQSIGFQLGQYQHLVRLLRKKIAQLEDRVKDTEERLAALRQMLATRRMATSTPMNRMLGAAQHRKHEYMALPNLSMISPLVARRAGGGSVPGNARAFMQSFNSR